LGNITLRIAVNTGIKQKTLRVDLGVNAAGFQPSECSISSTVFQRQRNTVPNSQPLDRIMPHLAEALGQLLVDGLQGLAVTTPGGIHLCVWGGGGGGGL
jgi:hypothetical protein